MLPKPVGIVGASGYSGIEATRILANHPGLELKFVTSDRWQGSTVADRLGINSAAGRLSYQELERSEALAKECAAVLLATPAESSLELAPRLVKAGVKTIDLSGAFRLKNAGEYPTFYKFVHTAPGALADAAYGLPELFRSEIAGASLIANPGCYPTGAALAIAPLLRHPWIDTSSIVVDACSGTTGAGRKGTEDLSFTEVDEDFRAYRVLRHQHLPEIAQAISRCAGTRIPVTFTAHLLPVKRGILSTVYARLADKAGSKELTQAFKDFYRNEPFVTVLGSPDEVTLRSVVGSNRCVIAVATDEGGYDPGRVVVISAIDNLVKGAAGQAVQNLNLALGLPEDQALTSLRGFYP